MRKQMIAPHFNKSSLGNPSVWIPIKDSMLDEKLFQAYEAAERNGLIAEGDQIKHLKSLIGAADLKSALPEEYYGNLRTSVLKFLDWLKQNIELHPFSVSDLETFAKRLDLQKSLARACKVIKAILAKYGIGAISDRIRWELRKSLRFFSRQVYRAVTRTCSGISKLGLRENHCNHHYFRRYLVPKPRGDFLYANA